MGDINECDILGKFVYKNVCFLEIQCSVFQLAPNFVLVNFSRLIVRSVEFRDDLLVSVTCISSYIQK